MSAPKPFQRKTIKTAPKVDWLRWYDNFRKGDLSWKQDEHVSIIGPTGTGKSALAVELLKIRKYRIFVMTKPEDEKLERALLRQNYVTVAAFPKNPPEDIDKYLLWPPGSGDLSPDGRDSQRTIIRDAFMKVFTGTNGGKPGRWCFCFDEARYVADPSMLGLRQMMVQLLIQGRSVRIAMMMLFQRPSWVPPEAYDQASHLFVAHDNDRRNVQRFKEIGGIDGDQFAWTIQRLERYEWAYADARPGLSRIEIVKMPKGL